MVILIGISTRCFVQFDVFLVNNFPWLKFYVTSSKPATTEVHIGWSASGDGGYASWWGWAEPPSPHQILRDTVDKRAVYILPECIHVNHSFFFPSLFYTCFSSCLILVISLTVFSEGDLPGPRMRFGLVSSRDAHIRVRVHKVRWIKRISTQAHWKQYCKLNMRYFSW